ncbi:MAG TPA: glutamate-cysteine ligase family protein [Candidatus Gastranaerophilales bacterium]|nr:glutamate-cysteine ligase family protein [Candidatus Gastranaerophilales bacterium]
MEKLIDNNSCIIDKFQLVNFFLQGFKPKTEFKIGVEYEKLGVHSKNCQAVCYSGQNSISRLLKELEDKGKLRKITENNNLIGLHGESGDITLEPGSQFEYSAQPFKTLKELEQEYLEFNKKTGIIAEQLGITFIGSGIQPLSTFNDICMIPKARYEIMRNYLPQKGSNALVMMMETAGTQVSVDFESEEDAMRKLRITLGLSPLLTAMFSNSPIRAGKLSGYKSYRAYAWLNTDNDRCGLVSKKVFDNNFSFSDYVDVLLDVPMFFIQRENRLIDTTGMTFREYMKKGFNGHKAIMEDWFLHMTTFFPDVRIKNYLEIRNCDCQRADMAMAFPALIKGIIYNNDAMEEAWKFVKDLSWEEMNELRDQIPMRGLNLKLKKYKLAEIAAELVFIAEFSLKSSHESIYLEKLNELTLEGKTPADIIIQNWDSIWNKDVKKLVEYARLD